MITQNDFNKLSLLISKLRVDLKLKLSLSKSKETSLFIIFNVFDFNHLFKFTHNTTFFLRLKKKIEQSKISSLSS